MHYNKRLQPCRISVKTSGSAPSDCGSLPGSSGNVMDLNYGFAANGNVLAINNNLATTRSQTFTYDNLNRIATAAASTYAQSTANCWGESFSIDAYGNLTGISNLSSAYNGCQDTENLSVSISGTSNRISGYCYDAAGNLTGQTNCSSPTYVYDAENRLISTAGVTYTYDGDGKRVSKSTSGSAYKLYWTGTGSDPLEETDGSGNTTNEYIFFGGKRIARRNSSGNVFYYLADHLGTSRMIVQAGQTSACYDADFYPYGGERTPITNTCSQNYKFTGKERDSESGLDNFGARYNSSWIGRFMSPDPLGGRLADPQTLNLYSYVRNNPLNLIDPTGMYICGANTGDEAEKCEKFENERRSLLQSKNELIRRGALAYGDPGDPNGVTVTFGNPGRGKDGITDHDIGADADSANGLRAVETVTIKPDLSGAALSAAVGHEGSHVADAQDFVRSISRAGDMDQARNLPVYLTEARAFMVTHFVLAQRGGDPLTYGGATLGAGVSPIQAFQRINRMLADPANNYGGQGVGVSVSNPGPVLYPNLSTPR